MIIPAIDLQNGEVVRLYKGDYARKSVYSRNPARLAADFREMGAKYLHIVDLDGAKSGKIANIESIRAIRAATDIPIQVGGGIRDEATVALYLEELGLSRVILGTVAVEKPQFVAQMIQKYGARRIAVSVDVREGKVATAGWLENSGIDYLQFIERLKQAGLQYIIVTDISRDGTLTSPGWEIYRRISGINVIVSGGVSCAADIEKARDYYGVIVGRAYYEGKVDLRKMLAKRIIPCLDTMKGRVVKGVNFVDLTDIGDALELAEKYEQQGADEIVLLDITATTEGRESMFPLLEQAAKRLSIPIVLGGGIRSIDDFRRAFAAGAAKAAINSAAIADPALIAAASAEFGRQRIIVAIDFLGREVFTHGGSVKTTLDLIDWAKTCEKLGAGELLPTSIRGDGAQQGFDIAMTKAIVDAVDIPVIASGGCGGIDDIIAVFRQTDCDAALAASLFHFGKATVGDVKSAMERNGIACGR